MLAEDLTPLMLADAGIAALAAKRVNWLTRPQGASLPAAVLQEISAPRTYSLRGRANAIGHLVQISCYGATYLSAKALAQAFQAFLDGLTADPFAGAFVENERDTFEPGDGPVGSAASVNFFRTDLDARIWRIAA